MRFLRGCAGERYLAILGHRGDVVQQGTCVFSGGNAHVTQRPEHVRTDAASEAFVGELDAPERQPAGLLVDVHWKRGTEHRDGLPGEGARLCHRAVGVARRRATQEVCDGAAEGNGAPGQRVGLGHPPLDHGCSLSDVVG